MARTPGIEHPDTESGRFLRLITTGEALGSKHVALPLLRQYYPEAYQRLLDEGIERPLGPDIYRAMRPEAGKAEGIIGGLAAGIALDPLSYLSGGLTAAGRAAKAGSAVRAARALEPDLLSAIGKVGGNVARRGVKAGNLTEFGQRALQSAPLGRTLGEQVELGQRALVKLGDIPLIKGRKVYSALDTIRAGKGLQTALGVPEDIANRALSYLNMPETHHFREMGKAVDVFTSRLLRHFNFDIGLPAGLHRSYKNLLSSVLGTTAVRAGRYTYEFEHQILAFAKELADETGVPFSQAEKSLKKIIVDTMEHVPTVELAKDARTLVKPIDATRWDKAYRLFQEEFPRMPWGPASPLDHKAVRVVKELTHQFDSEYQRIVREEERLLEKSAKLISHPEQDYILHAMSPKARDAIQKARSSVWRAMGKGGSRPGVHTFPAALHASFITRKFRKIDTNVIQELSPKLSKVIFKGKRYNVATRLSKEAQEGGILSSRTVQLLEHMHKRGLITPDELGRLVPAMSIEEINNFVKLRGLYSRKLGGQYIKPGEIEEFFERDPTVLITARGARTDRAVLSRKFFDEVQSNPSISLKAESVDQLPDYAKHWVKMEHPDFKGYWMAPEAQRWLNRMETMEHNLSGDLRAFTKIFQKATALWKAWTLAPFPSYHSRNFVGNLWLYYLGSRGAKDAMESIYAGHKAMHMLREGKGFDITSDTGVVYNTKWIWEQVAKRGGWGIGFITPDDAFSIKEQIRRERMFMGKLKYFGTRDPEAILQREYKKQGFINKFGGIVAPPEEAVGNLHKLWSTQNPWIETGFRFGAIMDDKIRMSHVIQKLKEGYSIDDAVASMKKSFFDYHDLDPTEKRIWREIFPFYAWTRKNVPFQLESLITKPDKIARFGTLVHAFHGWDTPAEEANLNSFLRERYPNRVRYNKKTGQWNYFILKNWLPLADIHDVLHLEKWALQSLNPTIQVPLETIANINFFTRRKIDRLNAGVLGIQGEKTKYLGTQMPNKLVNVLRKLRPVNEMNKIIDNPDELDFVGTLAQIVFGKLYVNDPDRSMQEFGWRMMDLKKAKGAAIRSVQRRDIDYSDQVKEINRISDLTDEEFRKLERLYGF